MLCRRHHTARKRRVLFYLLFVVITIIIILRLSSSRFNKSVNVYVVEEHHEALKYWHQAALANRLSQTGNTLIHIDAHADMGSPIYFPGVPFFTWSTREHRIRNLMQKNDVFIQGAAIIGMLDRVIWIYPSWDKGMQAGASETFLFELGYFPVKRDKVDLGSFCECLTFIDKQSHEVIDGTQTECSYSTHGTEATIEKSQCHIKRRLLFEIIADDLALEMLADSAWLSQSSDIILDIDEDYFGCETGGTPLEKVNVSWTIVERLDDLTTDLICAKNTIHEEAGDKLLKNLIADLIQTCRLRGASTCSTSTSAILQDVKRPILEIVHLMPEMFCHNETIVATLVGKIIDLLKTLTDVQQKTLATLGFCLKTSPATFGFDEGNAKFRVCHGANTPNNTIVSLYTPDEDEVSRRMSMLRTILEHITDLKPNIVTVCRSVRDGYTPRHLVSQIESAILDFLAQNDNKLKYNVTFDDNLLGGKEGWRGRHKTHFY